ncbi:chromosome segregation ATPase [Stutzerimonas stutzeri TS44]|nr:chromosome segregation ATPase [Stutzerimonas stutzeri TS44]
MKTETAMPASRIHLPKLAAVVLGGLLLTACAGNPPKEQFAVTESAVRSAVSAGGPEYAAVEMRAAQEKWKEAELAMQKEDFERARILAEQAEWDARVAERKAEAAKAQKAVKDAEQGVNELREEGMRNVQ